ncbi:MAG TPA: helix-turn-helix domain-containing protein, partial [Polyangiaceae bacterium]|nr:helix-turn-helix domain-containing protein [Polyangiaceae bacterium]
MGRPKHHHAALALPVVPRKHALLAPLLANVFDTLHVGVTLLDAHDWHRIHDVPHVLMFESEEGVEAHRVAYNDRCMMQAAARKRAVIGQHAGFSDLFVPIIREGRLRAMLAAGPFSTEPPTSREIMEHWRRLTVRNGHLADPEFALYVTTTLSTPVLDPPRLRAFKTLLNCFASLIASQGKPETLMARARRMKRALDETTFVTRMWEAARALVDPRAGRTWGSLHLMTQRRALNIQRIPERALVGLIESSRGHADPVDELVRRDAFQRACVRLARARGDIACGKVGDHGVTFLLPIERSESMTRARLLEIGERAVALARRQFQFQLHVGIGPVGGAATLPARYQAALASAERAPSRIGAASPPGALRDSRQKLGQLSQRSPLKIAAPFERYLELVAARSGYRVDVAQAHMDAGFERLTEPLLASGALDERSFDALCTALEQATESASTAADLLAAYRRIVADLEQALQAPSQAHQERSLRRAVTFIQEHLSEPLTLAQVARVAGFAETYFARLFKQRERTTFGHYVRDLRIERAKQLLDRTPLSVDRVCRLSGFSSTQYFH